MHWTWVECQPALSLISKAVLEQSQHAFNSFIYKMGKILLSTLESKELLGYLTSTSRFPLIRGGPKKLVFVCLFSSLVNLLCVYWSLVDIQIPSVSFKFLTCRKTIKHIHHLQKFSRSSATLSGYPPPQKTTDMFSLTVGYPAFSKIYINELILYDWLFCVYRTGV
jgi:hypothetical protein